MDNLDHDLPPPPELVMEPIDIDPHEEWAIDFVEEEIGRKDWANNWTQLKASGDLGPRLQAWMLFQGVEGDPQRIIGYVDSLVQNQGKQSWR